MSFNDFLVTFMQLPLLHSVPKMAHIYNPPHALQSTSQTSRILEHSDDGSPLGAVTRSDSCAYQGDGYRKLTPWSHLWIAGFAHATPVHQPSGRCPVTGPLSIILLFSDYSQNDVLEAHVPVHNEVGAKPETGRIGKIHKCLWDAEGDAIDVRLSHWISEKQMHLFTLNIHNFHPVSLTLCLAERAQLSPFSLG